MTSYQQAVSALHLCVQSGRSLLFFDEAPVRPEGGAMALRRRIRSLADAFLRGSEPGFRLALELYLEQALLTSAGSLEALQTHLTTALAELLEVFRRRYDPEDAAFDTLASTIEKKIAFPEGIQALLGTFRETAELLVSYGEKPAEARTRLGMEQARRYVDEHLDEPIRLKDMARRFGMSSSTFLRRFQKTVGRTFGKYLVERRIEEAKRLLATTALSMEQVAQTCGFNSASYFIQAFRRTLRTTPGRYREHMKVKR